MNIKVNNGVFSRNKSSKNFKKEPAVALPMINCKIGSLHSFLSIEEFRKGLQRMPEEIKYVSDQKPKRASHKIYVTMNEELSSTTKKETHNTFVGQEDHADSGDERKKLLYDKHIINRQKAAINICKSIVDEVKAKFGYLDHNEESEQFEKMSIVSEEEAISSDKLVKKVNEVPGLSEKFDAIAAVAKEYFQKSVKGVPKKKQSNELVPGDIEDSRSHDSSIPRHSRTKEKPSKEDLLAAVGNLTELFPMDSCLTVNVKNWTTFQSGLKNVDPEHCLSVLSKLLETRIQNPKEPRLKKPLISLNKLCISLPMIKLDSATLLFICHHFSSFKSLLKVDVSYNTLGDSSVSLLVATLSSLSLSLETLDISSTSSSHLTADALCNMLCHKVLKLQVLRIENNPFLDEGISRVAYGLLNNSSVRFINLNATMLEVSAGLAISKVLRINRTIKAFSMSSNMINGKALREISRALIINTEIVSVNFSKCELSDEDAKELGHMLNSNLRLQQLELTNNNISQKGLDYLRQGLTKNRSLVHLALSGNPMIKLRGLERLKEALARSLDIDISKEDDFFKSNEAKKYKLIEYLRYKAFMIKSLIIFMKHCKALNRTHQGFLSIQHACHFQQ